MPIHTLRSTFSECTAAVPKKEQLPQSHIHEGQVGRKPNEIQNKYLNFLQLIGPSI